MLIEARLAALVFLLSPCESHFPVKHLQYKVFQVLRTGTHTIFILNKNSLEQELASVFF
jgi:hypothetical protein